MKNMKKFASILMILTIIASLALPVFAAQTGNLKISGTQAGKTYDLYRVLDLTYSDGDGTGNYTYTVNPAFVDYFTEKASQTQSRILEGSIRKGCPPSRRIS